MLTINYYHQYTRINQSEIKLKASFGPKENHYCTRLNIT